MDITNGLGDIDPEWAPNPEELPRWFVDALAVPRDAGFVEVDGTRIHYFRWGRRGAPPVLMTHGFLAHARCFAFIAPFLAKAYAVVARSVEHTSELQSLMRNSYAVLCLQKKTHSYCRAHRCTTPSQTCSTRVSTQDTT